MLNKEKLPTAGLVEAPILLTIPVAFTYALNGFGHSQESVAIFEGDLPPVSHYVERGMARPMSAFVRRASPEDFLSTVTPKIPSDLFLLVYVAGSP